MTKDPVPMSETIQGTAAAKCQILLLKYPHMNAADIARLADCNIRSVYRARKILQAKGLLKKHEKHRTSQILTDVPSHPVTPEVAKVSEDQAAGRLTIDESLDMLSQFARDGKREGNLTLAKDAIKEFTRLESQAVEAVLGPPDPLTDADKIERSTQILDVIGPHLAALAVKSAFTESEDLSAFEEEFTRRSPTHSHGQRVVVAGETSSEAAHGQDPKTQTGPQVGQEDATSPNNNPPSLHIGQTHPELGGRGPHEEGLRNPPGLDPDLGSDGEVDPAA
jgi:hypothetical protein